MLIKSLQAAAGNAVPTDPNFEYVTMLLHGDGTNGAQNNTFLDSSVALTNLYFQTTQASSTAAFSSANSLGILPTSGSSKQLYDLDLGQSVTSFTAGYTQSFSGVDILVSANGTSWTTIYSGGSSSNTSISNSGNAFRYVRWWFSGGAWNFGLNNGTITRNGNTTQGTFSPYGDNWSNYFDGTGDYLSVADAAAFTLGTSNFCVEAWVYPIGVGTGASHSIIGQWASGSYGWIFQYRSNKLLMYYSTDGSSISNAIDTAATINNNAWNHIAFVRSGNTLSSYVNGTRVSTNASFTASIVNSSSAVNVGRNGDNSEYVTGYINGTRMVVGSSVYDPTQTTLTVPTAPLTAITNTSLLTCQSNRFIDNSSNNFTITRNGDVSVQRFSPFAPTAAYDSATIGGSGYFDGSGDYLDLPTIGAVDFGTGNFTMEGWAYLDSLYDFQTIIYTEPSNTTGMCCIAVNNTGRVDLAYFTGFSYPAATSTGAGSVRAKEWFHFVGQRNGNTWSVYLNGVKGTDATITNSVSSGTPKIGINTASGAEKLTGYLSNFKVTKGTALYSSNFTPPTSPVSAGSGTSLLLNFTNAGIIDNAMMNDLETVGNAQISTSVKKYGTGSIYVDGTGDWLFARSSPNISLSGNFTIEGWVYQVSNGTSATLLCIGDSDVTGGIALYLDTTSSPTGPRLSLLYNSAILNGSTAAAINTWHHIAAVRSGSTITLFLNGVSQGTVSASTTFTGNLLVGATLFAGTTYPANNYIDDLRITKGVARYTANFTPPTAAFPNN